jgi:hypothetical protein
MNVSLEFDPVTFDNEGNIAGCMNGKIIKYDHRTGTSISSTQRITVYSFAQ